MCIAAQFKLGEVYTQGESLPAFVLCTDGRASAGEVGSNDRTVKTHTLGHNFVALMAGSLSPIRDLCADLSLSFQRSGSPKTKADVVSLIKSCVYPFCASDLCPDEIISECLITGFVETLPVMVYVRIENKNPSVTVQHDYYAIGEGAFLADALLKVRAYDSLNADLPSAAYLAYEAKRFSESVASVGPGTWLKVHFPVLKFLRGKRKQTTGMMDINEAGIADLETWRSKFYLQPLDELKGRDFRRFR